MFSLLKLSPRTELTEVGYGLGASMYGMGMDMPYPYGMAATNPYAYTGMVCILIHIVQGSWIQKLIAELTGWQYGIGY